MSIVTTKTSHGNWGCLPENAMRLIGDKLSELKSHETLQNLRLVNRSWSVSVAKCLTYLKLKNLEFEELPDFFRKLKETFINVHRLDVPVVWFDDECCRQLAENAPGITSLELFWGDSVSDSGLMELARMSLKSLRMYHSRLITDAGIEALSETNLEELWLYGASQVTDDGWRLLEKLSSLKALRLLYCSRLSRCGLEPLVSKRGIQLFVRFCRRISTEISIS